MSKREIQTRFLDQLTIFLATFKDFRELLEAWGFTILVCNCSTASFTLGSAGNVEILISMRGPSLLATNMAYSVGCAGLIAFFFNLARQPLFIGTSLLGAFHGH
eukprot:4905907-Amphidinium_carterae.1